MNDDSVKPGIYFSKPFDWYESIDAVNRRALALLALSPAHLQYANEHPEGKMTAALKIGIAAHTRVLENRQEEGIKLTEREEDLVQHIQQAVKNHATAKEALGAADVEVVLVWEDPMTGLLCKARPDAMRIDQQTIYDLKTCNSLADFACDIFKKNYYQQAAWYLNGAKELQLDVQHFKFIAVEKKPIFGCKIYNLSPAAIDLGTHQNHNLLAQYKQCKATGLWPGYEEQEEQVHLPSFKMSEYAEQQEEE